VSASIAAAPTDEAELLPWPRQAEDGTPLGVDLAAPAPGRPRDSAVRAAAELPKLVRAALRMSMVRLDPEDVVQEVALTIVRRNRTRSAYDPRRCSWSRYVYMLTRNGVGHMLEPRWRSQERPTDRFPVTPTEGAFDGLEELDDLSTQLGVGREKALAYAEKMARESVDPEQAAELEARAQELGMPPGWAMENIRKAEDEKPAPKTTQTAWQW